MEAWPSSRIPPTGWSTLTGETMAFGRPFSTSDKEMSALLKGEALLLQPELSSPQGRNPHRAMASCGMVGLRWTLLLPGPETFPSRCERFLHVQIAAFPAQTCFLHCAWRRPLALIPVRLRGCNHR